VLGMTDRADSDTTYKQNRFHERWGGGRFAMKRLDSGASGTWGWEIYDYTMAKNDVILHEIQGSGTEPSNIVSAKAYSVWNDSDPENASDIDISLRTNNCLSPTTTLSSDTSFDLKAMVYKGAEAANQKLCVRISALHIPGSQTRKVALYTWYSDATTLQ